MRAVCGECVRECVRHTLVRHTLQTYLQCSTKTPSHSQAYLKRYRRCGCSRLHRCQNGVCFGSLAAGAWPHHWAGLLLARLRSPWPRRNRARQGVDVKTPLAFRCFKRCLKRQTQAFRRFKHRFRYRNTVSNAVQHNYAPGRPG